MTDDTYDESDIADRAELTPEEKTVGSDDPMAQSEAILTESEERLQQVVNNEPAPIARESEDTV